MRSLVARWNARLQFLRRALRGLAGDPRLPRSVRWLVLAGLLPIPGPVDEIFLLAAAIVLFFYRHRVREILAEARMEPA